MRSSCPYEPAIEIETTFCLRRKKRKIKEQRRKARRTSTNITGVGGDQRRSLTDFVTPVVQEISSSIARPNVDAHKFELKPAYISMVQQSQFGGTPLEDSSLHLSVFLEVCIMLKLNGVFTDAIQLHLFPFSLRDRARAWLHSLPSKCITTWDELPRAFLTQFFPPIKTTTWRNQITNFTQRDDETLYKAWEQFKDLLRLYPHHGLQCWMIIWIFYIGVTQSVRSTIDTTVGGTLINKTEDETYNLIEEIALNNFQWSTNEANPNGLDVSFKLFHLLYFLWK